MAVLSRHTVLLVEDEAFIAIMLEVELLNAGATVIGPAATVQQALALLGQQTPTCAVLDLNLNNDLSVPVANHLCTQGVPFVITSSYVDLSSFALPPAAAVLLKPYQPEALVAALNRIV